jgi:hypothetical protein
MAVKSGAMAVMAFMIRLLFIDGSSTGVVRPNRAFEQ